MKTTYYVVQSFQLGTKGVPFADQPFECQSEGQAKHKARMLADVKVAVIAFSRAGDPGTGDYDDAVVLAQYGELPEFADEMLVA